MKLLTVSVTFLNSAIYQIISNIALMAFTALTVYTTFNATLTTQLTLLNLLQLLTLPYDLMCEKVGVDWISLILLSQLGSSELIMG